METLDFAPSTRALGALVLAVTDDDLSGPTPCPAYTVADLVEHIGGLSAAFIASARKERLEHAEADGDGSRLEPTFRRRIADDLDVLAAAWTDPAAYEGDTQAGPIELPASVAAQVALNEVVVHAWDLAVATAQPYDADPGAVATCTAFVATFDAPANDDGGLFGPPVAVADDAPALDRLVAATGRDPAWQA